VKEEKPYHRQVNPYPDDGGRTQKELSRLESGGITLAQEQEKINKKAGLKDPTTGNKKDKPIQKEQLPAGTFYSKQLQIYVLLIYRLMVVSKSMIHWRV